VGELAKLGGSVRDSLQQINSVLGGR
jgi:hypothetical protein